MEEKEIRTVKIALLGLGAVGSQLLLMLARNEEELRVKYGIRIMIEKVLVRDRNKGRKVDVTGLVLTTEPKDILEDESIDIVVECMGGTGAEKARDIILAAMRSGKAVIMSSKKCLAIYGREIVNAAARYHCGFRYDACVGGCIPIGSVLRSMAKGEKIKSIYGIFNATSNYILTRMREEELSYQEVLKEAREHGFTEEDPSDDIDGFDTLYKLIILTGFGTGAWPDYKSFAAVPVSTVTREDIREAENNHSVIKAIGSITVKPEGLSCYIGPSRQEKGSLLAGVNSNYNMIFIDTELSGTRAFYGQGAGAQPTASVIYDDIFSLITGNEMVGAGNYSLPLQQ